MIWRDPTVESIMFYTGIWPCFHTMPVDSHPMQSRFPHALHPTCHTLGFLLKSYLFNLTLGFINLFELRPYKKIYPKTFAFNFDFQQTC